MLTKCYNYKNAFGKFSPPHTHIHLAPLPPHTHTHTLQGDQKTGMNIDPFLCVNELFPQDSGISISSRHQVNVPSLTRSQHTLKSTSVAFAPQSRHSEPEWWLFYFFFGYNAASLIEKTEHFLLHFHDDTPSSFGDLKFFWGYLWSPAHWEDVI